MMEKEFNSAKKAYEEYNLNTSYNLTLNLLRYIYERIQANKNEIEEILRMNKRKYRYSDLIKNVKKWVSEKIEYKSQINVKKIDNKFISAIYKTAIGVVAVECYDFLECVKYMIESIKTRNAIIISDVEYFEKDDKNFILMIIQEALKKFEINENLIQIVPYEECDYTKCDKVIYTYDNKNIKNREKNETDDLYVYIETEELKKEALDEFNYQKSKGNNVYLIEGNNREFLEKINKSRSKGVVIYTKNKELAYKFLTLVNSKNVFINCTLDYIENVKKCDNELLENKKIMYELIEL